MCSQYKSCIKYMYLNIFYQFVSCHFTFLSLSFYEQKFSWFEEVQYISFILLWLGFLCVF